MSSASPRTWCQKLRCALASSILDTDIAPAMLLSDGPDYGQVISREWRTSPLAERCNHPDKTGRNTPLPPKSVLDNQQLT